MLLLRMAGYEAKCFGDPRQALAYIQRERPSVVVTDLNMPHLSGLDLLGVLRSDPAAHDIPVIIMSANMSELAMLQARQLGVTEVFEKTRGWTELPGLIKPYIQQPVRAN